MFNGLGLEFSWYVGDNQSRDYQNTWILILIIWILNLDHFIIDFKFLKTSSKKLEFGTFFYFSIFFSPTEIIF